MEEIRFTPGDVSGCVLSGCVLTEPSRAKSIGRVQQIQLLRSGSVSTRCYWCILLDHPIAASAQRIRSATVESAKRDHFLLLRIMSISFIFVHYCCKMLDHDFV